MPKRLVILIILFLIFIFCFPGQTHATNSLIAHWKFDDGSGTAPVDSSGNNITGSFLATNPTWSTDIPSSVSFTDPYSLDFTGNHDGVTFSWPSSLNFAATDPRSFSFWYKPVADGETDGGYDRIISWSGDALEISGTDNGSSNHSIAYYDGNWHSTNLTLTLGTWYHITFTYDGTTAKFYIGNDLKDSHSLAGRALSGTIGIGTRVATSNEGINGRVDDVRIYNYALDATQVSNLTAGSSNPDATPAPSSTPTPTATATPVPTPSVDYSPKAPATCNLSAPIGTPNLFQINRSGASAVLYFSPVSNLTGYTVSFGTTNSADQYAVNVNNSQTTGVVNYTVNSLSKEDTYYFKVRGINDCVPGTWSQTVSSSIESAKKTITSLPTATQTPRQTPTPTTTPAPESSSDFNLNIAVKDDNNNPLPGVKVTIHSKVQSTVSDANGIAHFSNVEKGEHTIDLAYNSYNGEQKIDVLGDKTEEDVSIKIELKNSGFRAPEVIIVTLILILIILVLVILLIKKRKRNARWLSKRSDKSFY